MPDNLSRGRTGEDSAAEYLRANGYRIIARNFRSRSGEIDIIAWDGDTLCFVEVKARSSVDFGHPWEAISRFKRRQMSKAALWYLKEKRLFGRKARFDVVGLTGGDIRLFRNAFELDPSYG